MAKVGSRTERFETCSKVFLITHFNRNGRCQTFWVVGPPPPPPPELNNQVLKAGLGQLESEMNEANFKMFFTTPSIMN